MRKLNKIIKDIVQQQIQFVVTQKKALDKDYIRKITYKQSIITEDGVGKEKNPNSDYPTISLA